MSDEIIFERLKGKGGEIGKITLNRPKALNALSHQMCKELKSTLLHWQLEDSIKAVVITGAGDRAFCAGGDIKGLYEQRSEFETMLAFFNDEYSMNKAVYHFSKPYISFLDGITMGGGAGVSLHGSHRIATEKFSFAMPETRIGFFTDIGAAHFLNECPGYFGFYLALTGYTLKLADALELNLADAFIKSDKLPDLLKCLCDTEFKESPFEQVDDLILEFQEIPEKSELLAQSSLITHCFSQATVEDILDRLSEIGTDFSHQLTRDLLSRSPTALKVTFAHLHQAKQLDFDEIMQMNFNIVSHFLERSDFFEGIRAVVVDKDQKPNWDPSNVSDMLEEEVAKFFIERRRLS